MGSHDKHNLLNHLNGIIQVNKQIVNTQTATVKIKEKTREDTSKARTRLRNSIFNGLFKRFALRKLI